MQVYLVGGAVRDALMRMSGRDVRSSDKDWVVVGSSPKEMLSLGFIPVGHDFPVFLHPKTHEEYALARTERKSGHGYHGFQFFASPSVTLTEDLARRDLTINAMAMTPEGVLIDPFNGKKDLTDRILRHVGPAFCEDPVRILRLARFAARFADFTVAPETATLLETMVATGEADHLVSERVWAEVSRGLMEEAPSRMIRILKDCGFLSRVFAESPVTDSLLSAGLRCDRKRPLNCACEHRVFRISARPSSPFLPTSPFPERCNRCRYSFCQVQRCRSNGTKCRRVP